MDREALMARRAEIAAQLAATTAELERAETHLEQTQAIYRSTTDGLAQSFRAIERASTNAGTPPRELKQLMRRHTAAEIAAAKEYAERSSRWGHRTGDGHLYACPLGSNPQLAQLLVTADVLGTYRVPPPTAEVPNHFTVSLSRPVSTGEVDSNGALVLTRIRSRLRVPTHCRHQEELTLSAALSARIVDAKGKEQLARFLGRPLFTSIAQALASPAGRA